MCVSAWSSVVKFVSVTQVCHTAGLGWKIEHFVLKVSDRCRVISSLMCIEEVSFDVPHAAEFILLIKPCIKYIKCASEALPTMHPIWSMTGRVCAQRL